MKKSNPSIPSENAQIEQHGEHYCEEAFWGKIQSLPRSAIDTVLEKALLLRELLLDADTPFWIRGTLLGALGYLILPLDLVPDFLPGVGLLDDVAMLGLVLAQVEYLVTDGIRARVRKRMGKTEDELDTEATTDEDAE